MAFSNSDLHHFLFSERGHVRSWSEAIALCQKHLTALGVSVCSIHSRTYGEDADGWNGTGEELHAYACQERALWGNRLSLILQAIERGESFPSLRRERMKFWLHAHRCSDWLEAEESAKWCSQNKSHLSEYEDDTPEMWLERAAYFRSQHEAGKAYPIKLPKR